MRGCVCGALAVGVLAAWTGLSRADDQAEALKIVEAAIKAAGGEAKLDKLKIASLKGKGTIYEGDQDVGTFSVGGTVQGLDRVRLDLEINVMDRNQKFMVVITNESGWVKRDDRVEDAPAEVLQILKAELCALRLAQLPTLLKGKELDED